MALAWKAGWVQALAGSNPASSATPTRGNASHPDSYPLPSVGPGLSFGLSWFGVGPFRYPDEAAYPVSNVSSNGIGHVLIARSHEVLDHPMIPMTVRSGTPKIKSTVAAV
jgi:hypothetical protein